MANLLADHSVKSMTTLEDQQVKQEHIEAEVSKK